MLTEISLRYYKCFEMLRLPLGNLTLLTGVNASGKSTVLQTLCLLHQTMDEQEWSSHLALNGSTLQLGTVSDVVDKINGRRELQIGLRTASGGCNWTFTGEKQAMSMEVKRIEIDGGKDAPLTGLHRLLPADAGPHLRALVTQIKELTYISAERSGPRQIYPLQDERFASVVGPTGEYAASLLYLRGEDRVSDLLRVPDVPATLLHQVRARMGQFFPGSGLQVTRIPEANGVTLGLRTSIDTDFHRPVHVGFGLTQVLPIIIGALASKPGQILLIENPEVHLHPQGQVEMGQFLAQVAAAGVQVILETHSDHILNGLRKAVRANQIAPEQVLLHFFQPRTDEGSQVQSPGLSRDGSIDYWPAGFFDQFERDMRHLAGWDD